MSNIDTIGYQKSGQIFVATNVSAKIITVVGTAMTGLIVWNPFGSQRRAVLLDAGFVITTASPTVQTVGLCLQSVNTALPSSVTVGSAAIQSADGSAGNSQLKAADTATLPVAPVAARWIGGADWLTTGAGTFPYNFNTQIDGGLSLIPGAAVAFTFVGGTGMTGMGSLTWIEIPYP